MELRCGYLFVLLVWWSTTTSEAHRGVNTLSSEFSKPKADPDSSLNLDVWEFRGYSPQPQRLFTSVELEISFVDDKETKRDNNEWEEDTKTSRSAQKNGDVEYHLYQNTNKTQLLDEHLENRRFFGWFRRIAIWQSKQLSPFKKTYVGIETTEDYWIRVKVTNINYVYLVLFVCGFVLFFYAKSFVRNALFYYTSGVGVGLVASILIVVYVLHRFLPQRSVAYSVLIGGWSFSFYLLYTLYQNLYSIFLEYQKWVAVYLVTVVVTSFAVCYRLGPPKDPRSLNLCQWALMAVGLTLILASCQVVEIGISLVVGLLLFHNIPTFFIDKLELLWYRIRPPKPKLLSEDEYTQQGTEETRKALEALRDYCRSPDCNAWEVMEKVTSPKRFASFVSGGSHLEDDEVLQYDLDLSHLDQDDEEDDSSSSHRSSDIGLPAMSLMPSPSMSGSSTRSFLPLRDYRFKASTSSDYRDLIVDNMEYEEEDVEPRKKTHKTPLNSSKLTVTRKTASEGRKGAKKITRKKTELANQSLSLASELANQSISLASTTAADTRRRKKATTGSKRNTNDSNYKEFYRGLGQKMPDVDEINTSDDD